MATAAQLIEETEHGSDLEYPRVSLTAAGNSSPTEARQIILPCRNLHGAAAGVPSKLTTLEPRVFSDLEPIEFGGTHLGGGLAGKVGAENWTAKYPLDVVFLEGACLVCLDVSGLYLKGGSFGKLEPENLFSAYPLELLDSEGRATYVVSSKSLATKGPYVSSMCVAPMTHTQQHLPVSERLIIATALESLSKSEAEDRTRDLEAASQAINKAGVFPGAALFAIQMLLNSKRSRRVDDATDLLSSLGLETINSIAYLQFLVNPPDGNNDDLWYALIRAAGYVGDRSLANHFLESQYLALQEASVVAIADVGDSATLSDLKRIAEDTNRSHLIRELAEELASDLG
jgi:hypothetical protein